MEVFVTGLTVGQIETNCYVCRNSSTGECLVVDPGDEEGRIEALLEKMGARPAAILLTHGHFDHILAAGALRERYHVPVYAYEGEASLLREPSENMSSVFGAPYSLESDVLLTDGQELTLAGMRVQCLFTPGHTPGGCCYYLPEAKLLFAGDTLFRQSVGRTDFPGGNGFALRESLARLTSLLPEETQVYPGHGSATTIGFEKRMNPYVNGSYSF